MIDGETPLSICGCEDQVRPSEADIGLIDDIKDRLVDPQTTWQGVDELGAKSCRLDSYQYLDRGATHFGWQLVLVVEDGVGQAPQLS